MSEQKDVAKAAKKAAKSRAKLDKKLSKEQHGTASQDQPGVPPEPESTPAERSAAAAERQVRLQRFRVWISLTAALIALATLLVTFRPWEFFSRPEPAPAAAPSEGDGSG